MIKNYKFYFKKHSSFVIIPTVTIDKVKNYLDIEISWLLWYTGVSIWFN